MLPKKWGQRLCLLESDLIRNQPRLGLIIRVFGESLKSKTTFFCSLDDIIRCLTNEIEIVPNYKVDINIVLYFKMHPSSQI